MSEVKQRKERPATREQEAKKLRDYYPLGLSVLSKARRSNRSVFQAGTAIASAKGVSADQARKAARFASAFSQGDLDRLCKLCLDPKNTPLTFNHVRRVLWLKPQKKRMDLLTKSAQGGWTSAQLERAIRLSEPNRSEESSRRGGPRLTRPADLAEALEQIHSQTQEWLKRYAGVWRNDDNWPPALETGGTVPSALVASLDEARRGLRQLSAAAEDAATRLDKIKRTVKPRSELGPSSKRREKT
jgi:hypothetical protein